MKTIIATLIFISLAFSCSSNKEKLVLETFNSGGYTYMRIKENGKIFWAATRQIQLKLGDKVFFTKGKALHNFKSKTLNKTFDTIYFVSQIRVGNKKNLSNPLKISNPHSSKSNLKAKQLAIKSGSIKKAQGGYTISECYSLKEKLSSKIIKVRGQVVKFSPNIMKRNWIHIQDGTAKDNFYDLTITSKEKVKPGQIITVSGKISYDKTIGPGYKYKVILENAKVLKKK